MGHLQYIFAVWNVAVCVETVKERYILVVINHGIALVLVKSKALIDWGFCKI